MCVDWLDETNNYLVTTIEKPQSARFFQCKLYKLESVVLSLSVSYINVFITNNATLHLDFHLKRFRIDISAMSGDVNCSIEKQNFNVSCHCLLYCCNTNVPGYAFTNTNQIMTHFLILSLVQNKSRRNSVINMWLAFKRTKLQKLPVIGLFWISYLVDEISRSKPIWISSLHFIHMFSNVLSGIWYRLNSR